MTGAAGCFSSDLLLAALSRLPQPGTWWLGFSGGADSTALLLAMHEIRPQLAAPIHALHFHHGLNREADRWMEHCRQFCARRDIPFSGTTLDIPTKDGRSIEEAARDSRYDAVAGTIGPGDVYLTAHHADDQAETLFLNLMRGSGVEGLAGIPELRKLGQAWVARPLLEQRRVTLEAYLRTQDVDWLEDPSNADQAYDRNFLRRNLLPLMEQRWPGVTGRLTRTARHARLASTALASLIERHAAEMFQDDRVLSLEQLLRFDRELQPLILRQWLRRQEIPGLPESRIREFLNQLNDATESDQAETAWGSWQLKRYRGEILLQERKPLGPCPQSTWTGATQLKLGAGLGTLQVEGAVVSIPSSWQVRSRQEGDRMQLHAGGPRRKLKDLLRESAIPPWMRHCIPVLYWDDEPVALGDWALAPRLQLWLTEQQADYRWYPADPLLLKLQSDCHFSRLDRQMPLG